MQFRKNKLQNKKNSNRPIDLFEKLKEYYHDYYEKNKEQIRIRSLDYYHRTKGVV